MSLIIYQIPVLNDNYNFILTTTSSQRALVVDPSEFESIHNHLHEKGLTLSHILITHHHWDHVGGAERLKEYYGCKVFGPRMEAGKIPVLDTLVCEKDVLTFNHMVIEVLEVPGHTLGHVAYHIPSENVLFIGDTLFSVGCGRLFEGTPEMMTHSLNKIMSLAETTTIYCAHEYTLANCEFALTVDPTNLKLQEYYHWCQKQRNANQPTVPTTLKLQKEINPFLRVQEPAIRKSLKLTENVDANEAFARLRALKDQF